MSTAKNTSLKPRERLLETADRLFYKEGIRAVGIDRVIAEAGVAKMTLYSHFPSKDDLILAVLKYREANVIAFFNQAITKHALTSGTNIEAFFAAFKDWLETPEFRGCAFINANVELADATHPGSEYSRNHKVRFHQMLHKLVQEALGKSDPALARGISLLVEGAITTAQFEGSSDAANDARNTALRLIRLHSKK